MSSSLKILSGSIILEGKVDSFYLEIEQLAAGLELCDTPTL
jgi:hypothetical protein